jgi:transposase
MIALGPHTKVYLVLGATDMRKAINGLSLLVAGYLEKDVFSGNLFVFCNRSKSNIKVLYWDRNGFCLWQKRLEQHRYHWPSSEKEVLEWDTQQLRWLLDGLKLNKVEGHPNINFSNIT